jgi:hypothetical protein
MTQIELSVHHQNYQTLTPNSKQATPTAFDPWTPELASQKWNFAIQAIYTAPGNLSDELTPSK